MNSIDLKVSADQVVNWARQLPREFKLQLIREWLEEINLAPAELLIEDYEKPFQLDEAKIEADRLSQLKEIWKDELPAEELVQLLNE